MQEHSTPQKVQNKKSDVIFDVVDEIKFECNSVNGEEHKKKTSDNSHGTTCDFNDDRGSQDKDNQSPIQVISDLRKDAKTVTPRKYATSTGGKMTPTVSSFSSDSAQVFHDNTPSSFQSKRETEYDLVHLSRDKKHKKTVKENFTATPIQELKRKKSKHKSQQKCHKVILPKHLRTSELMCKYQYILHTKSRISMKEETKDI